MIKLPSISNDLLNYYLSETELNINIDKIDTSKIILSGFNDTTFNHKHFIKSLLIERVFSKDCKYKKIIDEYIDLCYFSDKDIKFTDNIINNKFIRELILKYSNYETCNEERVKLLAKIKANIDEMNIEFSKIFKYEKLSLKIKNKVKYMLNINVCPYCNRNYISNFLDSSGENKSTASLDHFYPKSIFPLFSLSLYNFVPSCSTCNSLFKRNRIDKLLYPYESGFNENTKFTIDVNDSKDFLKYHSGFSIKATIIINKSNSSDNELNNIEIFKLEPLYQNHVKYALDIKKKEIIYKNYLKRLDSLDSKLISFNGDIDILLYGLSLKDDQAHNKILFKLTKDLIQ